jgi:hypothetical protein
MHSRVFRIFLLVLVSVWYGAVLPGHTRGVVQLPGVDRAAESCCAPGKAHRPGEPVNAPTKSPLTCAVCAYMGALLNAAPPELGIAPLGPTDERLAQHAPTPIRVRLVTTYLGRAPPLA